MDSVDPYGLHHPERRAQQLLQTKLYGRYMLEDQTEHPCSVIDISVENLALRADHVGNPGEKVIAYLDQLGRLEGVITRTDEGGFAMTLVMSEHKKEKLQGQLRWLDQHQNHGTPEDRRHERVAPRNPMSVMQMADGRRYNVRIIDLSLSGAAVECEVKPALGVQILLGTMRGKVVRHFEEGIAIEFASIQQAENLESNAGVSAHHNAA